MSEERKPNYLQGFVILVCAVFGALALVLVGWDWVWDLFR